MKNLKFVTLIAILICANPVQAEKICIKGSNPSGKKVRLTKIVVDSSASCPKRSIEILNTATLIPDSSVTAAKISTDGAAAGTVLMSNGASAGFTALTSESLPSDVARLNKEDQEFTGTNSFPSIQISTDAGSAVTAPRGQLNRDNVPLAWARVNAAGGLDTSYNISSLTKVGVGRYSVVLSTPANSGFSLIPVVTPELDPDGMNNPPSGAASIRIPAVNLVASGSTFEVYLYNGSGTLADGDFQFMVMGR